MSVADQLAPKEHVEIINANNIIVDDRARKDYGDIDSLAASVREFGIIQPIVVTSGGNDSTGPKPLLVAGGRRLAALKRIGIVNLRHGIEWVYREEVTTTPEGRLRLKAVELEENLKRKDMEWYEVIAAKKTLLETMEKLHGVQKVGGFTREEVASGKTDGFGVRKLAAMLGESAATTSNDLNLADMCEVMPKLKTMENKSSAQRNGMIAMAVHLLQEQQKMAKAAPAQAPTNTANSTAPTQVKEVLYALYKGRFQDSIRIVVPDKSVDLVYTDLPYGTDLDEMTKHASGAVSYSDKRQVIVDLLPDIAAESFRILKDNKFGVFWFGFNYYTELVQAMKAVGFGIHYVPIVWLKHRNSTEDPVHRYGIAYEQALVVVKGYPLLLRPGQSNIVDIPAVSSSDRLQQAQQPVELPMKFILDMTLPTMTVVDLCAGVGTTGVAAVKNNRKVILFEKDPEQCVLADGRLRSASGLKV